MAELNTSKTTDLLRVQMLRTDACQQMAFSRLSRALNDYAKARSAYQNAVVSYIQDLEEKAGSK